MKMVSAIRERRAGDFEIATGKAIGWAVYEIQYVDDKCKYIEICRKKTRTEALATAKI